jgi:hypothetical protein
LQDRATEPKELLRIDQETGRVIVLFRLDAARFDRAADDQPFAGSEATGLI